MTGPDAPQKGYCQVPARPDWADALVVRDGDGDFWGRDAGVVWVRLGSSSPQTDLAVAESLTEPVAVVLDADGNPPAPEETPVGVLQAHQAPEELGGGLLLTIHPCAEDGTLGDPIAAAHLGSRELIETGRVFLVVGARETLAGRTS